jgi:hypothetical protein
MTGWAGHGQSGITAIADLRKAFGAHVPAFLMRGDIAPEWLREARESGHLLLHKPLRAMALRAMINRLLLKSASVAGAASPWGASGVPMNSRSGLASR